jgi:Flp pilus assembly protein TadB
MPWAMLVPLGVFAMLVAFSYFETRAAIADREARSRELLAAMEKGVPLPAEPAKVPQPPALTGHPLKSALAVLAVGVALWLGLAPGHRVWGMVVTALGIAGLLHWVAAGKRDWKQQREMEEEMHRAYLQYVKSLTGASTSGDGPHA